MYVWFDLGPIDPEYATNSGKVGVIHGDTAVGAFYDPSFLICVFWLVNCAELVFCWLAVGLGIAVNPWGLIVCYIITESRICGPVFLQVPV